jgi:AraC family transcriptional regulator of adaptative response/methylated-DNA-[protein]-cysteine methyltransferase
MLFDLPNPDALYEALVARDPLYDGRAYVGVATTGVFCRLTCPARKPNRENCRFFATAADCIEAGFRPCKRCRPLAPAADCDPAMRTLLDALEREPGRRWMESDISALGFDPSTVRRSFKRQFGATFLEIARLSRLRDGFETLSEGGRVIDAQLNAGFDSPSGFRTAFARLLGEAPSKFTGKELLKADWIDTPLGAMIAVSDASSLHLLEFADRKALPAELKKLRAAAHGQLGIGRHAPTDRIEEQLGAFFRRERAFFDVPLSLSGSAFTRSVWEALRRIPVGETRSYRDIAIEIGAPSATRAVARANGANQIALVIPCHRVIGADGSLTGYGGGLWRKHRLIEFEQRFRETVGDKPGEADRRPVLSKL